ncbi:MAG: OmpH family outer membrane protein [Caulobacteraceae bacterium]
MIITALTGAGAALALLSGAAAAPQAPSTAGSSTQAIVDGPVISGVCVLSPDAVLTASKVGQAANLRLQQLTKDAQDEMAGDRTPLETEARTIESEGKSLSATQLQKRREALAIRVKALQDKAALRSRELEYTRVKVVQQISQQAQPVISSVYKTHSCGLLFRRDGILGGNPTNDLTAEVVRGLDAKMSTITFQREALPASAAQSSPAA